MIAARFVHLCFYGLMFALPMTGWLMSSAAAIPVSFLGPLRCPTSFIAATICFPCSSASTSGWDTRLFLFAIHMGAALRHHFVFRDDTLRRMLP